jgi:hypothetical protein
MRSTQRLGWRAAASAAVLAAALAIPAGAETAKPGSPADVANQFLRAFEKKDWKTVGSLFAPGARTSAVNLSRNGAPELASMTAEEWLKGTEQGLAPMESIKLEVLDVKTLEFEEAASVSARFQSKGTFGGKPFTNNGIDTYSMVRVDGAWKILHYTYFERLDLR